MYKKISDPFRNLSSVDSQPLGIDLADGRSVSEWEASAPFFWNGQTSFDEGIHSLSGDTGSHGHRFGNGSEKMSFRFDSRGFIDYISPKTLRILHLQEEDIIGKNIIEMSRPLGIRDLGFFDELWHDFHAQHLTEIAIDDRKHWILWNFEAQINPDATIGCVIATGHEITDFVQKGNHVVQEKNRDFLTGLWNRQGVY
jgi:PAS domain-containing protein